MFGLFEDGIMCRMFLILISSLIDCSRERRPDDYAYQTKQQFFIGFFHIKAHIKHSTHTRHNAGMSKHTRDVTKSDGACSCGDFELIDEAVPLNEYSSPAVAASVPSECWLRRW